MGLLDSLKRMLRGKSDEIGDGIDKVADVVDDKTKGKHGDTIDDVADKAKDIVDGLDDAPSKPDAKP